MLASTTGVEEGDFVVVTSDHIPVSAGAYITSVVSGSHVVLSEALSGTLDVNATVNIVNAERALAVTGLSEDLATSGMGVTLLDKDQTTHTFDSTRITGQVTFNSTAQFTVQADTDKGLFTTAPGSATLKNLVP